MAVTKNRMTGDNAEDKVISILQKKGLELLVRNYSVSNCGELDSVFIKGDDVYIVEVRSRRDMNTYYPIDQKKITKIKKTALRLISAYGLHDKNIIYLLALVTHNQSGLIQNVEFVPFE